MILSDKSTTPNLYADLYSNFKFIGTPCLAYRDMPDILNKYVSGKKVLDYGCGTAESTLFLKSLGYDVVAVDINERMLSIAQERDPNGKYTKINSFEGFIRKPTNIFTFLPICFDHYGSLSMGASYHAALMEFKFEKIED